jgi:hypothetical protein
VLKCASCEGEGERPVLARGVVALSRLEVLSQCCPVYDSRVSLRCGLSVAVDAVLKTRRSDAVAGVDDLALLLSVRESGQPRNGHNSFADGIH